MKQTNVKPAEGKLGILIVGCGAVATTLITGVLMARKGIVMVSPFISPQEKRVMQVLLQEQHPFILLTDNGFRDYYKHADALFEASAAGRLLILSPWQYDDGKRHISRSECVALNAMAEEICKYLNGTEYGCTLR